MVNYCSAACSHVMQCFVYFIPRSLAEVALLCILQMVNISSAVTGAGTDPELRDGPGREDGLVQDGARNHATAADDSRLCAA